MNNLFTEAQIQMDTIIGALMASVGFFLSRFFVRADASRDDIAKINQAIGLLNAAKERSFEKDTDQQARLDELEEEVQALRERVVVLEHE
jgi:hypothetical protein